MVSSVLNINSVVYVAESFEVNEPSDTIERRDENNDPSGQVSTAGFVSGTALLQLDNAEKPPVIRDTFVGVVRNANVNFYVSDVGIPESQGEAKKCNITFRKRYN
jgi:hypothetical protein